MPGIMSKPLISIILPVFNNAPALSPLYEQINRVMLDMDCDFEVIFVDDASIDNSLREMESLKSLQNNIVLVRNEKNNGQQRTILRGLAEAKGNYCVVMDADLQDSPAHIKDMLMALKPPYDAVFALRGSHYQPGGRMLTSRIYKSLTQALSGLSRDAGTFFIIRTELVRSIMELQCRHTYVTYMVASLLPGRVTYIQTEREKRPFQQSQYTFLKRLKAGFRGISCIIECKYKSRFILGRR
jgi:dolichol-phosphate mannosyltransferase